MSESEKDQAIRAIELCNRVQESLRMAGSEELIRKHIASLDAAIGERLKAETQVHNWVRVDEGWGCTRCGDYSHNKGD